MPSKKIIAVLGTLDTKGAEVAFIREQIEALGGSALVLDMGVIGSAATSADVTREQVAEAQRLSQERAEKIQGSAD